MQDPWPEGIEDQALPPTINGLVERSHQTMMRKIGKLREDKKADWPGTWLRLCIPIMPPNAL